MQTASEHTAVCHRCVASLSVLMADFGCLLQRLQSMIRFYRDHVDRCRLLTSSTALQLPSEPQERVQSPQVRCENSCLPDVVRRGIQLLDVEGLTGGWDGSCPGRANAATDTAGAPSRPKLGGDDVSASVGLLVARPKNGSELEDVWHCCQR